MTDFNKSENKSEHFSTLLRKVRQCTLCEADLPQPPHPVLAASQDSKIVIIGQAPGIKAHESSKPWNDKSGDRLRHWLGIEKNTFYNTQCLSLIPMGFCFPGYLRGADAPPRKECAPTWHPRLLNAITPRLTILVGRYAQQFYQPGYKTLTLAVEAQRFDITRRSMFCLPHPSGRNNRWMIRHPWFEDEIVPQLRKSVAQILNDNIN